MSIPKFISGEITLLPCVFCIKQAAVLFCRADSARLCLFCDQHVHSANLVSRKHFRSKICDLCRTEPAAVQCCTDRLALCHVCDWEVHDRCAASPAHERIPFTEFSGVPSVNELASVLKMELGHEEEEKSPCISKVEGGRLMDHVGLPVKLEFNSDNLIGQKEGDEAYLNVVLQRKGRLDQLLCKQLLELFQRSLVKAYGGINKLGPVTPNRELWQTNMVGENVFDDDHQQGSYQSLLRLLTAERESEKDITDSNPNSNTTQVLYLFHYY